MTTRLVCRSAPLPTKRLADTMRVDSAIVSELDNGELILVGLGKVRCVRKVESTPAETDVGQCWSEEIFSLL